MELLLDEIPKSLTKNELDKKPITKLSKQGYSIIKKTIPLKLNKIKRDLTVKPFIKNNYGAPPKSFKIYLEGINKIYVPKFYGINNLGKPLKTNLFKGEEINLEFKGKLRPKQEVVIKKFTDSCNEHSCNEHNSNGGIISVGCGFGKTVLALYLIGFLKKKTLVIVHKEFLLNQWKERINEYLPGAKIGILQGSKIDIDDKDIVIGMLQSISMKDYDTDIFKDFGFCIIDECHHIGAEVFSRSLPKINSYYLLGLSATPKRSDGLNKVFEWYLGPYLFVDKNKEEREVEVNMIYYDNIDPSYSRIDNTFLGKPNIPKMITNISNSYHRNKFIVHLLLDITKNLNRKILILGDRRDQLYELDKLLKDTGMLNIGYYVGGMKEKDLKLSEKCQIILATYSMSSEGMDIPSLNTLMMISSKSNIEQSVGRILRKYHKDTTPQIYDIVDNFSIFGNQANKRMKFYQKNKYIIYTSAVRDDFNTPINKLIDIAKLKKLKNKKSINIKGGTCII